MKRIFQNYLFLGGIAGSIIIVDQITKWYVRQYVPVNGLWAPWDWLMPFARVFHTQNTGVAFGMFKGANVFFAILAVIVSIAIIYYYPRVPYEDWILRIALSMQLAGAMGNLIDRIIFGYVTDFISVGTFAIWNIADASITMGVVVLLLGVWLQDRKRPVSKAVPVEEITPEIPDTAGNSSGEVKP